MSAAHPQRYSWYKIAENSTDLFVGETTGLKAITVNGKKITIARFAEEIFATAHKCPHAGGILADGFVDVQGNLVCPLHRYRFSLRNGRNTSGEGYYLKTYPLEIRDDGIYVGLEEGGFLSWLK